MIPDENKVQQRESIVKLGLQYSLLTRHTSFIAVDETVRNTTGDASDVKQSLPLPKGVTNHAVGQPMPEPELLWLGMMMLLMSFFTRKWKGRHALRA